MEPGDKFFMQAGTANGLPWDETCAVEYDEGEYAFCGAMRVPGKQLAVITPITSQGSVLAGCCLAIPVDEVPPTTTGKAAYSRMYMETEVFDTWLTVHRDSGKKRASSKTLPAPQQQKPVQEPPKPRRCRPEGTRTTRPEPAPSKRPEHRSAMYYKQKYEEALIENDRLKKNIEMLKEFGQADRKGYEDLYKAQLAVMTVSHKADIESAKSNAKLTWKFLEEQIKTLNKYAEDLRGKLHQSEMQLHQAQLQLHTRTQFPPQSSPGHTFHPENHYHPSAPNITIINGPQHPSEGSSPPPQVNSKPPSPPAAPPRPPPSGGGPARKKRQPRYGANNK